MKTLRNRNRNKAPTRIVDLAVSGRRKTNWQRGTLTQSRRLQKIQESEPVILGDIQRFVSEPEIKKPAKWHWAGRTAKKSKIPMAILAIILLAGIVVAATYVSNILNPNSVVSGTALTLTSVTPVPATGFLGTTYNFAYSVVNNVAQ